MAEFAADEDGLVTFKASRRKIFGGKAGRVRVGRSSLREISNTSTSKDVQEDENEATVELGALIASVGSQSAADTNNNDKMVYTAADMQKAEAVSKEAVAIADSLLSRAESAEREVASLIKSMGELEDMRSKVRMLEEEKEKVLKSVDEKVASAKKKVYDKVQAQFSAGNKEFQKLKDENEKISKENEKLRKDLADTQRRLDKETEAMKLAIKTQKETLKKKKESREFYFVGLIKEILPSGATTIEALKTDKNDTKLLGDAKAAVYQMKEKLSTASKLQSTNRSLQEKLKTSEQAVKDAANVENSLFASKNELEKELMAAKQNLAEQAKMNEQLVEMLEKSSGL